MVDRKSKVLYTNRYKSYNLSMQPGEQRSPVPAIRYSRGVGLPREVFPVPAIVSGVDVWVLHNGNL